MSAITSVQIHFISCNLDSGDSVQWVWNVTLWHFPDVLSNRNGSTSVSDQSFLIFIFCYFHLTKSIIEIIYSNKLKQKPKYEPFDVWHITCTHLNLVVFPFGLAYHATYWHCEQLYKAISLIYFEPILAGKTKTSFLCTNQAYLQILLICKMLRIRSKTNFSTGILAYFKKQVYLNCHKIWSGFEHHGNSNKEIYVPLTLDYRTNLKEEFRTVHNKIVPQGNPFSTLSRWPLLPMCLFPYAKQKWRLYLIGYYQQIDINYWDKTKSTCSC